MVGQRILQNRISSQIAQNKFPKFSIFIGEAGGGKHLLADYVATEMNCHEIVVGCTVDSIRIAISEAYKVSDPTVYIIENADNMSQNAANALLKVTEEPPNSAYFILLVEGLDNLLPTIKSRGVTYMLDPYTYEELSAYLYDSVFNGSVSDDIAEFILSIATVPGDVVKLSELDIPKFRDFVTLVVDNIAETSGSNVFKIGNSIALKDEEGKYNLALFWRAFCSICTDRMVKFDPDDCLKYSNAVAITSDFIQQLSIRGINKQMLFDSWILDIRGIWM